MDSLQINFFFNVFVIELQSKNMQFMEDPFIIFQL